jgi:hypothetical protein
VGAAILELLAIRVLPVTREIQVIMAQPAPAAQLVWLATQAMQVA